MLPTILAMTVIAGEGTPQSALAAKINQTRAEAGLMPLQRARAMDRASQWFAEDLARRNGVLDHVDSQGRRVHLRLYDFGYRAIQSSAENLALTTSASMDVHRLWLDSSGHRRNLMSPEFQHMGIGVATNSDGRTYWVLALGQRFKGAPALEP